MDIIRDHKTRSGCRAVASSGPIDIPVPSVIITGTKNNADKGSPE